MVFVNILEIVMTLSIVILLDTMLALWIMCLPSKRIRKVRGPAQISDKKTAALPNLNCDPRAHYGL